MNSSARALLITKEPTGYDLIGQLLTQFSSSIRKDTGFEIYKTQLAPVTQVLRLMNEVQQEKLEGEVIVGMVP